MFKKSVALRVLAPVINQKGEVEVKVEERVVRLPLTREDRFAFGCRLKG